MFEVEVFQKPWTDMVTLRQKKTLFELAIHHDFSGTASLIYALVVPENFVFCIRFAYFRSSHADETCCYMRVVTRSTYIFLCDIGRVIVT